jgi:hypothetical protein
VREGLVRYRVTEEAVTVEVGCSSQSSSERMQWIKIDIMKTKSI